MNETAAEPRPVRWGIGDAAIGWIAANLGGALILSAVLAAAGYTNVDRDHFPLWLIAVGQVPLWFGYVGAVVVAGRVRGQGVLHDFKLWFDLRLDVVLGVVVGLASQFVLVPLISLPWIKALGKTTHDLDKVAKNLTDKAHDPLGVVLLVLILVIGAPIVEELFFRGLLLRSIERRFGTGWAIGGSALVFGVSHFELLQLPALVAFGAVLAFLAVRYDRLGPSILAHMTFNAATVVVLLTS
jgi:membrane protease YdiL (CAAX protease family)